MGTKENSNGKNLAYRQKEQVYTVDISNTGVHKMEYELEEVERDYVAFRREMGEE